MLRFGQRSFPAGYQRRTTPGGGRQTSNRVCACPYAVVADLELTMSVIQAAIGRAFTQTLTSPALQRLRRGGHALRRRLLRRLPACVFTRRTTPTAS